MGQLTAFNVLCTVTNGANGTVNDVSNSNMSGKLRTCRFRQEVSRTQKELKMVVVSSLQELKIIYLNTNRAGVYALP